MLSESQFDFFYSDMLKTSSFIWNGAFKRAGIKLLLWESKEIQLTVFSGLGLFCLV